MSKIYLQKNYNNFNFMKENEIKIKILEVNKQIKVNIYW